MKIPYATCARQRHATQKASDSSDIAPAAANTGMTLQASLQPSTAESSKNTAVCSTNTAKLATPENKRAPLRRPQAVQDLQRRRQ
jgi:hypothetical protein